MTYLSLLRQHPRYIIFGLLHYFFSSPGQTFFISLFVPYWLIVLSIDNIEFGSIYSGATLLSAFVLPWLGQWLDRIRLRYVSIVVGIAFLLFCVWMACMSHPVWLFVGLFGLRLCGQGLMSLTASTSIARFFGPNRGKALSLVGFGVSFGEFLLPLLLVFLLGYFSWQAAWLMVAASIALIFLPLAIGLIPLRDPFQTPPILTSDLETVALTGYTRAEVLRDPLFYLILAFVLCQPFFYTGVIIHQHLLAAPNGWSVALMAQALSVFGLTRLLGNLLVGPLIDRLSAVRVFAYILIPMIVGCLAFVFSNHISILFLFFLMGGLTGSFVSLTGTAILAEIYGVAHLGAIRSMVSTVMVVSTAVAPIVLGWALTDSVRHRPLMGIAAGFMIVLTLVGIRKIRK